MKYSEWILEQSISTADITDIELETYIAEMDVCCELLNLYAKRAVIMEYAEPTSEIYQEAAEETGDAEEAATAEGEIKEKWYVRVKNFFASLLGKVAAFFGRNKYDKLIKMVKESDTQKYTWRSANDACVDFFAGGGDGTYYLGKLHDSDFYSKDNLEDGSSIMEMYNKFGELLLNNDNNFEKWENLYNDLKAKVDKREAIIKSHSDAHHSGGASAYTIDKNQVISILERLNNAQKTDLPEINKLIRNIKSNNKKYNKGIEDKETRSSEKQNQQKVIAKINQIAKLLSTEYSYYSKELMRVTSYIVRDAQKQYKKETKVANKATKQAEKEAKKNSSNDDNLDEN